MACDVSVYEQAPALGEVGAGVFLTPNSVRQLQRVGPRASVERWGARVGHGSHYFRHDGAPIAPVQVTDSAGWNATFGMHRADLVEMLARACRQASCTPDIAASALNRTATSRACHSPTARWPKATSSIAADGIHSELRPYAAPPSRPVFHGSVAYRGVLPHARIPHWPTDRWQMWLGKGKHFLSFPVRAGRAHQLCRLRAGRRRDEGILVGARRSRCAAPRVRRLGPAHREPAEPGRKDVPLGAVRSRAAADLDQWPLDAARRCRASDAAASRPGRQPVDRGRHGAGDNSGAGDRASVPAALLAYERLRRERVAAVQRGARENGMRYDSSYADLGVRDAEISAHAAFRRRLYDHDVVPEAQAAAAALG